MADDPGHTGQRLDVVDDGGPAAKPAFHGIRRPQPGHATLAFQRLDQGRLFTADECARTLANLQLQGSEKAALFGLPDGRPRVAHGEWILGANVEVAFGRTYGVGRDGQTFQYAVRDRIRGPAGP